MFEILKQLNELWSINLNGLTQYNIIKETSILFADLPIFIIPLFLLSFWLIYNFNGEKEKKENLLFIFYSVILGVFINVIIQKLFYIDRPQDFLQNSGNFLLNHIPNASFPSDHATVSFAFLTAIFLFGYRKITFLIFPLFIIMLLSRIVAGVHWSFDIIAGIFIGIISAIVIRKYKDSYFFVKTNSILLKMASYLKI
ncbi:MAG: phosphatase PAP2 family protein [Candidatus Gracilibacteria bacterium]|nr:phosphatase PAP2 family protein [Candidatus Gracilibacteria bacterium]